MMTKTQQTFNPRQTTDKIWSDQSTNLKLADKEKQRLTLRKNMDQYRLKV